MSARLILTGSVVGQCDFLGILATGYVYMFRRKSANV
jgi:hypothetical protein